VGDPAVHSGGDRGHAHHRSQETRGVVALLPLYGVIAPKANVMTEISGGTSVDTFAADFRSVMQDPDVKAVVIDIDSPGGSVAMVSEMAGEIRVARGRKPIIAVANSMAASAAYWIGSQADEFVATKSSLVGSVGVYGVHEDISGMQEQMGIKSTVVSAGKHKADGLPFGPLSDDAKAHWQSLVGAAFLLPTKPTSCFAASTLLSPGQRRFACSPGRKENNSRSSSSAPGPFSTSTTRRR
jgi:signal peptide peptidase SppA